MNGYRRFAVFRSSGTSIDIDHRIPQELTLAM